MLDIDLVKKFGKIEFDDDDEIIELCLMSAGEMLKSSGVSKSGNKLYIMAVCRLTLHYYENREEMSNFKQIPFGINTMIEQLRNM